MKKFLLSSMFLLSISTATAAHRTPEPLNQTEALFKYVKETPVQEISVEKVEALFKNGAHSNIDIEYESENYTTLFHELIEFKHKPEVIETFINYGANITTNINGKTPLHRAFDCANIPAAKVLIKHLQKDDFNKKNEHGYTPVHMVISCLVPEDEKYACLSEMIKKGGNPNQKNKYNITPIFLAALYRESKLASLLLQHKAHPNKTDRNGVSPLHICLMPTAEFNPQLPPEQALMRDKGNMQKTVDALLAANANPLLADHKLLMTSLEYASRYEYDIKTVFKKWLKTFKKSKRQEIIRSVQIRAKPEPIEVTFKTISANSSNQIMVKNKPGNIRLKLRVMHDETLVGENNLQ